MEPKTFDSFPAKIGKNGRNSKGITIPHSLADKFELGKTYIFTAKEVA